MAYTMLTLGKPLPDDLLKLIGLITQLTGQIEYELVVVIKRISPGMSLENAYELAQARVYKSFRKAMQREVRERYERLICNQQKEAELDKVLNRLDDVATRRAKVTHDCWAYIEGTEEICRKRFGENVAVDYDEMLKLSHDMKQVIADLTTASGHPEFIKGTKGDPAMVVYSSAGPSYSMTGLEIAATGWIGTDYSPKSED